MIIPPGLAASEIPALLDDLRLGPYLMHPVVKMLDLDHNELDDLTDRFLDGQVDVSPAGRSVTLTVVDHGRQIALDGASPASGAIFYDKMIAASIRVKGPRVGKWVSIPVFCGPVASGSRNGPTATIVCEGKQRLAMGAVWRTMVFKAGTKKVDVIRDLLVASGEAVHRIVLPGLAATLPKDLTVPAIEPVWPHVVELVRSLGRQGFYDAAGVFRLRAFPKESTATFFDGEGGNVLTPPEISYPAYTGFNGVRVKGAVVGGKQVGHTVFLPVGHPLSPVARKRGGVPYRRPYDLVNKSIRDDAEAKYVALEYLYRFGRETVTATVDVMPNWLFEPYDVARIQTKATGVLDQIIDTYTMPMIPGGSMTLGANRPVARPRPARIKKPRYTDTISNIQHSNGPRR